jgi:site-specific DNA recombinase
MIAGRTAIYARVSSEAQARENTIASQLASLRERVAADGLLLEPDDCYVDEGFSGSVLIRPALERPRDAAAGGQIKRLYVSMPLIAWLGATPIKRCSSTSFGAPAWTSCF